jgi:hypothetical protein
MNEKLPTPLPDEVEMARTHPCWQMGKRTVAFAKFASACETHLSAFPGIRHGANGRALAYAVTPMVQIKGEYLAIFKSLQP